MAEVPKAMLQKRATDRNTAGEGQRRRPPTGLGAGGGQTGRKAAAGWDWVDGVLLAGIAVLTVLVVVLSMPLAASAGAAVWWACGAAVRFWQWPWWVWTVLGVMTLGVLLWMQQRCE